MSQEKLTPEQVQRELEMIEEEHDDADRAADGRREMKLKELRARCPHVKNVFGHCDICMERMITLADEIDGEVI
jgi:hypothetical protein